MFQVDLPRTQKASLWESRDATQSKEVGVLQKLFDANLTKEYEAERKNFEKQGLQFRQTDDKVFQILESDKTCEAGIRFQVKGGCMTWYIIAPKDETHQSFRDELYQSAAVGHLTVENHCEKYWRGTNSLHIKKMHGNEKESGFNHNHYRIKEDLYVEPKDVAEHLIGTVKAQRDMKLYSATGREKFMDMDEASKIILDFTKFWVRINHSGQEQAVSIGEESLKLPARDKSLLSLYKEKQEKKLSKEDNEEWEKNKHLENPCTSITPDMPIADKLKAIQAGMRGLGSELAHTRQLEGSKYKVVTAIVQKDDAIPVKVAKEKGVDAAKDTEKVMMYFV